MGNPRRWWAGGLATLAVAALTSHAQALSIDLRHVRAGSTFPIVGGTAGAPPSAFSGSGSLQRMMRQAERAWETAITDPRSVRVHYGWGALAANVLGSATVSRNRATIVYNNSVIPWFIDPTPWAAEEFGRRQQKFAYVDGQYMLTGSYFRARPAGPADGSYDLLTTARHEVGHGIGALFHIDGEHADLDQALLVPYQPAGLRREVSAVDVYKTTQFIGNRVSEHSVPLGTPIPPALPLALTPLVVLAVSAALRHRQPAAAGTDYGP